MPVAVAIVGNVPYPDVRGRTQSLGESALGAVYLSYVYATPQNSAYYPANTILDQSPSPDSFTEVSPTQVVTLTLSLGPTSAVAIFPTGLQGLTFDGGKTPTWKTGYQEALSGKATSIGYQQYPIYQWELTFELLRNDTTISELKQIFGLFNYMQGQYGTFLYTDPDFNAVTDQVFGIGDGVTTSFPLTVQFMNSGGPGISELVQNLNGLPTIKYDSVTKTLGTDYTIGPTAIITFNTAPSGGKLLTWTGSFYYRCRFMTDAQTFTAFVKDWWATKSLKFRSVIL